MMRRMGGRVRLASIAVAVGAVVAVSGGGIADAHASLERSVPASGQTLGSSPASVVLWFSEEPDLGLTTVSLEDGAGAEIAVADPAPVPGAPRAVRIALPELERGSYSVVWRTVATSDSHPSAGVLSFGVGVPPLATQVGSGDRVDASPGEVVARWLFLVGVIVLLGSASFAFATGRREAMLRPLGLAIAVAMAGAFALVVIQWGSLDVEVGTFAGTAAARAFAWRIGGLVLAAVGLAIRRSSRPAIALVLLGTTVAVTADVSAGHAAGGSELSRVVDVAIQSAHLLAVGVWIGGLVALLVALRATSAADRGRVVRRFSAIALAAVGVVALTGAARAIEEVGSPTELVVSGYGRVVLGKVAGFVALIALGAWNRRRNVPRAEGSVAGLRRVSRVALGVAAGVVAASALLMSIPQPTPDAARAAAAPVAPGIHLERSTGTQVIDLLVTPGLPGSNRFDVVLRSVPGKPVPRDVELSFSYLGAPAGGEVVLPLTLQPDGRFSGVGEQLGVEGPWQIALAVDGRRTRFIASTVCDARPIGEGTPQVYTDPAASGSVEGLVGGIGRGRYQVHFTYLDAAGHERSVEEPASIVAIGSDGRAVVLREDRLGRGHLVGEGRLPPGTWSFWSVAGAPDGDALTGCFEAQVGE